MQINWEHKVLETKYPPTQSDLSRFGLQGFELVSVLHVVEENKWVAYFKRQISQSEANEIEQENIVTESTPNSVNDIPF